MASSGDEAETRPASPASLAVSSADVARAAPRSAFEDGATRFEIGEELGRGGMGRVVAATDRALERPVAIKHALSDRHEDLVRFEREVRITALLEHPSIVPIHDTGRDAEGRPFYVMRQIQGVPLSERVAAARGVSERLALVPNVLAAVDAAAFAHARRIVHRDIKPSNILIGTYGETLLIDWGIARMFDAPDDEGDGRDAPAERASLTRIGSAMGTAGYMSPEQARGERVDARADVYALGATLYHVLAGASLLGEARDETAWIARAAVGIAAPLDTIDAGVPRELVAIVGKALEPDKARRYADAQALAVDLRAFLAGQLVAAHTYTARERIVRFARRHRVAVAIVALAFVALVAVGVFAVARIIDERDRATAALDAAEAERAKADERAELLVLDRALALAARSPERAVALLRQIPASSSRIQHARDVAAAAAASGISHGYAHRRTGRPVLAMSPSGHRLLSAIGEEIAIHDLPNGPRRLVTAPQGLHRAVWMTETVAVYTTRDGIYRFDLDGARSTRLAPVPLANRLWRIDETRFRILDGKHRLFDMTLGGAQTELAPDVADAESHGEEVIAASTTRVDGALRHSVRLITPGGTYALLASSADAPSIAISRSSRGALRAVVRTAERIVEWGEDGAERQRWDLTDTIHLTLDGDDLLTGKRTDVLALLDGGRSFTMFSSTGLSWYGRTPRGLALVDGRGTFRLVGGNRMQHSAEFDFPAFGLVASPNGPYVAIGSHEGAVRWWDTSMFAPEHYPMPDNGTLCGIDDSEVYIRTLSDLLAIDRRTGARRTILSGEHFSLTPCTYRGGAAVLTDLDRNGRIVDVRTGATHRFEGDLVSYDRTRRVYVYAAGKRVFDLARGAAPVERWTSPDKIWGLASDGRWILVGLDHGLARIDRETGAAELRPTPGRVVWIGIESSGVLWYQAGGMLWFDDGTPRPRVALPSPVSHSREVDGGRALVLEDRSLWFLDTKGALVARAPANDVRRVIGFGTRSILTTTSGDATLLYPGTGVTFTLRHFTFHGLLSEDDQTLGLHSMRSLLLMPMLTNERTADLKAWIDEATNAVLDPASNQLTWR